jgi:hypothetical protein
MFDEPFQVVEKHLHIHKPRVEDILNLFSKYFVIGKVSYIWQSLHSTEYLRFSSLFRALDKAISMMAQILPSLFARLVLVRASKKRVKESSH